jgi:hypothetical protein
MISNGLRGLPFSRIQALKSADWNSEKQIDKIRKKKNHEDWTL